MNSSKTRRLARLFAPDGKCLVVAMDHAGFMDKPLRGAEVIPGGFLAGAEMRTPEKIAASARIAMEAGADVIKTFYTGDADSFRAVIEYCPVPLIVLGGERAANDRELLQNVCNAQVNSNHTVG